MSVGSDESLSRALNMLNETARTAEARASRIVAQVSGTEDLCEMFLAESRMRRAHLREWIEMLSREAGNEARMQRRKAPASRPSRERRRASKA